MKTGLYQHFAAPNAHLNIYGPSPVKDHVWFHTGGIKSLAVKSRGKALRAAGGPPRDSWVFIASRDLLNWKKVKDDRP